MSECRQAINRFSMAHMKNRLAADDVVEALIDAIVHAAAP
jgi:hypothetical protein